MILPKSVGRRVAEALGAGVDHVELAIVLAVDGSASVTYEEFGLIAGGMAVALRDRTVAAGLIGTSVLALLLWSGAGQQDIMTGWTRILTEADLRGFADDVENMPRTVKAGTTAIGEALLASLTLLAQVPAVPKRNIVNVIGDGRSNDGIAPGPDSRSHGGGRHNDQWPLHPA